MSSIQPCANSLLQLPLIIGRCPQVRCLPLLYLQAFVHCCSEPRQQKVQLQSEVGLKMLMLHMLQHNVTVHLCFDFALRPPLASSSAIDLRPHLEPGMPLHNGVVGCHIDSERTMPPDKLQEAF